MEHELKRIADALELVIQMVKKDQEETKKRWKYEPNEDDFMGSENRIEDRSVNPLIRIADALEEILRLVKEDQERSRKYMEDRKDD